MYYIEWYDYSEERWRTLNSRNQVLGRLLSLEELVKVCKETVEENPTSRYRIVKVVWES
jgi:hypothetical protein